MQNFTVGEETDQRDIAQLLLNYFELSRIFAELMTPARDARDVKRAPGRAR